MELQGNIYLVTNSMDGLVRTDSTFVRLEAPTLVGRYFTQITFVDADNFSNQQMFSLLNNAELASRDLSNKKTLPSFVKRDSIDLTGFTLNWDGYGDDPNGN
jgi:hypothetical protein